jgi:hypothetical protein
MMQTKELVQDAAYWEWRCTIAEEQRREAVWLMQSIVANSLNKHEEERLQRLRDYAYHLQNQLDTRSPRFNMDHTKARLSAICWAVSKISGVPFSTDPAKDQAMDGANELVKIGKLRDAAKESRET